MDAQPMPMHMVPMTALADSATVSTLRALCELMATARESTRAGSVTFRLDRRAGSALDLARRARRLAEDHGLRHRVEIHGQSASVHVWRGE
jgi:hypothetical protein